MTHFFQWKNLMSHHHQSGATQKENMALVQTANSYNAIEPRKELNVKEESGILSRNQLHLQTYLLFRRINFLFFLNILLSPFDLWPLQNIVIFILTWSHEGCLTPSLLNFSSPSSQSPKSSHQTSSLDVLFFYTTKINWSRKI